MKTKSLLLTAALVILSTLITVANDPINTGLFVLGGKSGVYKLIYEGEKPASITLTIYNSKGVIVYEERMKKMKGFIRPVNFKGMRNDTYTFNVRSGDQNLEAKVVYVVEKTGKVTSRNVDANKFAIFVSNQGADIIEVKIFDADKKLIEAYQETVNGSFGKIFNLSKIKSSSFTFEVYNSTGLIDTITF